MKNIWEENKSFKEMTDMWQDYVAATITFWTDWYEMVEKSMKEVYATKRV